MNLRRVLFRFWAVISGLWGILVIAGAVLDFYPQRYFGAANEAQLLVMIAVLPPAALYAIYLLVVWGTERLKKTDD